MWLVFFRPLPDSNLVSWLLPAPQPLANRGPPVGQGDAKLCFWLVSPGGGREGWELFRLVFQDLLCPIGSGGQLDLYSEYFAITWHGELHLTQIQTSQPCKACISLEIFKKYFAVPSHHDLTKLYSNAITQHLMTKLTISANWLIIDNDECVDWWTSLQYWLTYPSCVHWWGDFLRHCRARHLVKAARCWGQGLSLEDMGKHLDNTAVSETERCLQRQEFCASIWFWHGLMPCCHKTFPSKVAFFPHFGHSLHLTKPFSHRAILLVVQVNLWISDSVVKVHRLSQQYTKPDLWCENKRSGFLAK